MYLPTYEQSTNLVHTYIGCAAGGYPRNPRPSRTHSIGPCQTAGQSVSIRILALFTLIVNKRFATDDERTG